MGSMPSRPPGATNYDEGKLGWKGWLVVAMLLCVFGFGTWCLSQEYVSEPIHATIVTTYTTEGGLISSGDGWTVYKTERGRIIRRGIWGVPGETMVIYVRRNGDCE